MPCKACRTGQAVRRVAVDAGTPFRFPEARKRYFPFLCVSTIYTGSPRYGPSFIIAAEVELDGGVEAPLPGRAQAVAEAERAGPRLCVALRAQSGVAEDARRDVKPELVEDVIFRHPG